ncbi:MAG: lipopolysaccharide assembly protein LapA domain-containing protein [Erysipelotrichaceae bacterium]
MQQVRFVIFVALAILVALFAVLNAEVMTLNLLFVRFDISASIVILASVLLGGLLTVLFGLSTRVKSHLRHQETRKQVTSLQSQLDATKISEGVWKSKYEEVLAKSQKPVSEVPTSQV